MDDVQSHLQIRVLIHIHVADAGAGLDAGHQGVFHAGADEPRAAPGDQQIHQANGPHQLARALPGGVLNKAHRFSGQSRLYQSLPQGLNDGVGGAEGLLAAPEDADIAAFQRQCRRVGGDVGTALIDDGNHAHGHGDPPDGHPVGTLHRAQGPAHRVRQRSHLPHALRHGGNPVLRQGQPVQHHLADSPPGGVHIQRVGGEDCVPVLPQTVRHGAQGDVLLFRAGLQQRPAGLLRSLQNL